MSREKVLWGFVAGLAALTVLLAALLAAAWGVLLSSGDRQASDGRSESAAELEPSEEKIIAQVGNITLGEKEFISGLRKMYGDEYVMHWMKRTAVQLEAQALRINISRSDIDEELERMQAGYESPEAFYRVMREQLGLTEEDLRNDALYRLMLERIATYKISVTDADVERYIAENPEEFEPIREIRYAQIVTESREQALRVLEELEKGVDFALLAKDVSIDAATAEDGGDSGWLSEDDPFVDQTVMGTLKAMEVGDVSGPIQIGDNWMIVTLLGRRTINPLDDSNVREMLKREIALSQAPSLFEVEQFLLEKYNAVDFLESDW